jgi:GT2 family glycosyltransferase
MVASEFPAVRVIRNEVNQGISGWNRGFETGTGDYFLVLDDDCYISGDSLKRAITAAQAHAADLVSFEVTTPFKPGFYYNRMYDLGLLGFWGCSAVISRRAIAVLRGFDPNIFVWAHEVEFTMRLLDAGFKHLFLPEITSYHLKTPTEGDVLNVNLHRHNQRHLAYGAAKLMRLPHALCALGNMLIRVPIWAYHFRSWPTFVIVPELLKGFWTGLRNRQPVSWTTSAIYKRNFIEYINPLPFVRNPKRAARFRPSRPRYYPGATATLQLKP